MPYSAREKRKAIRDMDRAIKKTGLKVELTNKNKKIDSNVGDQCNEDTM